MSQNKTLNYSVFVILFAFAIQAQAAKVSKMAILSAPQTVTVGQCSRIVNIQSQTSAGQAVAVSNKTKIFFTGSDASLKFYTDSACAMPVSTLLLAAGQKNKSFYFKGSSAGLKKIIVATYNYEDASQTESLIVQNPDPVPVPTTTTTTSTTTTTTTTLPSSTGSGIRGRDVPAPLYGVTLDSISNASAIVSSLKAIVKTPTARIVFDKANSATYYKTPIQQIRTSSYVMGQVLDSTDMATTSVDAYAQRTKDYVNSLGNLVDIWEIGNEINGKWVGKDTNLTGDKVRAAFDVVHSAGGVTALTFFWEGNPGEANNCVDGPGFDMFGWIDNFLKNPENARVRDGLDYVLISWYPQQCNDIKPDWSAIYSKLSQIFPHAKVGFGEIGTEKPQGGSQYEINLINEYYPMARNVLLPSSYIGGYFWWYFDEEMVPTTKTPLMDVLNKALLISP